MSVTGFVTGFPRHFIDIESITDLLICHDIENKDSIHIDNCRTTLFNDNTPNKLLFFVRNALYVIICLNFALTVFEKLSKWPVPRAKWLPLSNINFSDLSNNAIKILDG